MATLRSTDCGLMSLPGDHELLAAGTLLAANRSDRSNVQAAAEHVWRAMFHRDEWAPNLQKEADALQSMLFKYGTIQMTVDTMDDAELTELHAALSSFIKTAENAARDGGCASGGVTCS